MKKNYPAQEQRWSIAYILACCGLFGIWLLHIVDNYKVITVLAGIMAVVLLLTLDIRPLKRLSVSLLCGYVLYSGLSGFWAMSGKFYLREYSKIFIAFVFFLAIVMRQEMSGRWVRRILGLVAGTAAVFSALSVEAAATRLTQILLKSNAAFAGLNMEFSDRLVGILGNPNILASILGVGIFASLALLCGAETPRERDASAVLLALNAFSFLLAFSMGGTFCFGVAVIVYLIFAGKQRAAILIRMLEGAVPALLWGGLASLLFNRGGVWNVLPLVVLALNCATVVLLERKAAPHMIAVFEQRQKLAGILIAAVAVLGIAYVVAGYNLSGPFTFQDSTLRRGAYPEAGTHTLSVVASGDVNVVITSQNMSEVMMHTETIVYTGPADQAQFTVPESSKVCYFTFSAAQDTVLSEASIDGSESIRLKYLLLPGFIADRLQGLWANQNAIQRVVFFQDGMEIFRQHPVLGSGVGSFETAVTSVQEFYYTTRYVHNHYIQILLETGVPGLLLFVGSLLSLAVLLWKRGRERDGGAQSWAYPALWASLAMVVAHSAVEVSMSNIVFLTYVYVVFGLIVVMCPDKKPVEEVPEVPAKKRKGKAVEQEPAPRAVRFGCAALPAFFALTVCLNLVANAIMSAPSADLDGALSQYVVAATIDPYEKNDAKLSYLLNAVDELTPARQQQADQYASELMEVQSNSIPRALVYYYLSSGQYVMSVQAAQKAAVYSATDSNVWNNIIELFRTQFTSVDTQALQGEDGKALLNELLAYYQMLQQHNQSSMDTIQLTPANINFFNKLLNLEQADGSESFDTINSRLLFRSWLSCDADGNGVPDQFTAFQNAHVGEGGSVELEAGGTVSVTVDAGEALITEVTVSCANPESVLLLDQASGQWIQPDTAENGMAVFPVILYEKGEQNEYTFQLSTSVPQTFSTIEILSGVTES